jgi:hypothetical protein
MAGNLRDQAYNIAVNNAEEQLIDSTRAFEDSERQGDANGMAYAYEGMRVAQANLDRITGADQPQQQQEQLLDSEIQFLNRRAALGDDWRTHPQDYVQASARALAAGLQRGSPQHLKAVEMAVESMGDGRQPLLNERSAAEICGVDEATYAAGAIELARRKRSGHYQD